MEGRSSSLKFWSFLRCRSLVFLGYKSLYQIQGNTPLGYQPAQVCCKNRVTNSKFISWVITLIGKLVERTPPKTRRFFRLTFKKKSNKPLEHTPGIPKVQKWRIPKGPGYPGGFNSFQQPPSAWVGVKKMYPKRSRKKPIMVSPWSVRRTPSQLNDRMVPSPFNLLNVNESKVLMRETYLCGQLHNTMHIKDTCFK